MSENTMVTRFAQARAREGGAVEPVIWQWRGHIPHNDNWYPWESLPTEAMAARRAAAYSQEGHFKTEVRALYDQSAIDTLRAQLEAAKAELARLGRELSAVEFAIEECTRNGEIPYCIESVWAGVIDARTKEAAP